LSQRHPKITIAMPSYNQAPYLTEAIESILRQDYPNLEFIIIDGGSTDGSVDIIKSYESHLDYWVSEKDSGQSEAINKGLAKATGERFNWINSDDVLFPGALHRVAELHNRYPKVDMIVGGRARSSADGRIFKVSSPPSRFAMAPRFWSMFICQQAIFVRTERLRKIGGLREDLPYVMDTDLYYRLFRDGCRYVRANVLLGLIREQPTAKGVAHPDCYAPERRQLWREYGIHPVQVKIAQAKTRFCRFLDGSYLRSFVLQEKWRGRRPWDVREDPI
jgi:glycosyltransferase involved in cell wall biosynthesis